MPDSMYTGLPNPRNIMSKEITSVSFPIIYNNFFINATAKEQPTSHGERRGEIFPVI